MINLYFILLILVIVVAIALIFLFSPVYVFFHFDTDEMDMHVNATWLSVIKMEARIINRKLFIKVKLFNRNIISRFIKIKPGKNIINEIDYQNTNINIKYSFNHPHLTGILYSVVNVIGSVISNAKLEITPVFIPVDEFIRAEAQTTINAWKTLMNLIKLKYVKRKKSYGTT